MNLINNIYKERFLHKNKKCRYNSKLKYMFTRFGLYKLGLFLYFRKYILDVIDIQIYKKYEYDHIDFYSFNNDGKLHNEGDSPALIEKYYIKYYKNGILHRDGDSPALIDLLCEQLEYYKNGKRHRDDDENGNSQPAIIYLKKLNRWFYKNGKLHRDDNKKGKPQPALIKANGHKFYYKNDVEFFYNKKTKEITSYKVW